MVAVGGRRSGEQSESFTGRCAITVGAPRSARLAPLHQVIPLGGMWPGRDVARQRPVPGHAADASSRSKEHLIFRNVCVTAPVGMSKSCSIFRPWSIAAARAVLDLDFDPKAT
jgi:hypothetical protein